MKLTYSITFFVQIRTSNSMTFIPQVSCPPGPLPILYSITIPCFPRKRRQWLSAPDFLYPIIDLNIISTLPHRFTKSTATLHLLMSLALTNSERSCMKLCLESLRLGWFHGLNGRDGDGKICPSLSMIQPHSIIYQSLDGNYGTSMLFILF